MHLANPPDIEKQASTPDAGRTPTSPEAPCGVQRTRWIAIPQRKVHFERLLLRSLPLEPVAFIAHLTKKRSMESEQHCGARYLNVNSTILCQSRFLHGRLRRTLKRAAERAQEALAAAERRIPPNTDTSPSQLRLGVNPVSCQSSEFCHGDLEDSRAREVAICGLRLCIPHSLYHIAQQASCIVEFLPSISPSCLSVSSISSCLPMHSPTYS